MGLDPMMSSEIHVVMDWEMVKSGFKPYID